MTDGREDSEDILRFLASNVESIRDKVGGIENRLGGIETRIGRVEDHMATKEDVTAIRGDIERVRFTDRQYRPYPFHAHGSSGQRGQPVTECCVSTCQGSSALVHNSDRGRELAWPRLPSSDHLGIRHPERRHGVENLAPDPCLNWCFRN